MRDSLAGCQLNDELPFVTMTAEYSYNDDYTFDIGLPGYDDLSSTTIVDKRTNKKISKLIAVDIADIYFTDQSKTEIDHIVVERAGVLKAEFIYAPGGGPIPSPLQTNVWLRSCPRKVILEDGVTWKDYSVGENKYPWNTPIYLTFRPEKVFYDEILEKTVFDVVGIYINDPR